jgi:hypothetical protein
MPHRSLLPRAFDRASAASLPPEARRHCEALVFAEEDTIGRRFVENFSNLPVREGLVIAETSPPLLT